MILNAMKIVNSLFLSCCIISIVSCANFNQPLHKPVKVQVGGVTYTSLDINQELVQQAIRNSKFEIEQRGDAIVVIMPVKASFNAKRHDILLPVTLTPLTNIAKLVKQDKQSSIVIVGHTDTTGAQVANNQISSDRAKSVGSVLAVAGLARSQIYSTGVGSNQPRGSNKTLNGREKNKRVELIIVKKQNRDLSSLTAIYSVTNYKK